MRKANKRVPTVNLDATVEIADWIKYKTWDGPRTRDEMEEHLRLTGQTWQNFKRLPSYRAWLRYIQDQNGGRKKGPEDD